MMVRQGLVFVVVGMVLVCADWAVFVALSAVGAPAAPANIAGRLTGAMLGFLLNGSMTFRDGRDARLGWRRFARFALLWTVLTALSTTMVAGAAMAGGLCYAWAAKPLVEALMASVSFVVSRQWVFR